CQLRRRGSVTMANFPVRLGAAENTLIEQLKAAGADQAAERIETAGLPTRRVEAYHYTDLKTLLRAVPAMATAANGAVAPSVAIEGAYVISIVNGAVQASADAPAGV